MSPDFHSLSSTARRAFRRLQGAPRIPVVHHRSYRQWISGVPMDALRTERILGFLLDEGWVGPRTIHSPRPASMENLQRVHATSYLRSLDDSEVVARVMGVPMGPEEARAAVALQRLAVGGTIQASRLAIRRGGPAIHLGGGFHHAAPDRGSGFCLLNDVAVAITRLRARGYDEPILVVDLDLHDGNGTRAAFARDPSVHTYSIHNEHWDEVDAVGSTSLALGSGIEDGAYLDALRRSLPEVVRDHRPGLVFYLAGTDPAADDAFGDARLSADALLDRDRFVVEEVRQFSSRVPLTVLLAGGYGPSAWRYSARFLGWLYSGREVELPDDVSLAGRSVRWLEEPASELSGSEGSSGEDGGDWLDWGLSPEDVAAVAPGAGASTRLLDRFGVREVEAGLERFGVLQQLRGRGYPDPLIELNPSSGLGQTLRVWDGPARANVLMELRLRIDDHLVSEAQLLFIEWLLLQDPRRAFPEGRGPLPGQKHPGLGVLADVIAWLVTLCDDLGLDGMGFRSSHFHIAALAQRHLSFVREGDRERFHQILNATAGLPLAEVASAVEAGGVLDPETKEPFRWVDVPMIMAVDDELRRRMPGASLPGNRPRPRV